MHTSLHRCERLGCGTYCSLDRGFSRQGCVLGAGPFQDAQERRLISRWRKQQEQQESFKDSSSAALTLHQLSPRTGRETKSGNLFDTSLDAAEEETGNPVHIRNNAIFTPQELEEKLRENPKFLMQQLCLHLRKHDHYNRGMVPCMVFLKVLRSLGAIFPSTSVSVVLHYCIITHDNFVVYKPLLLAAFSDRPGQKDQIKDHICPPTVWREDIYPPACPKNLSQQALNALLHYQLPPSYNDTDRSTSQVNVDTLERAECLKTNGAHEQTESLNPRVDYDPFTNSALTPRRSDAVRRLFAMWDRCLINDDRLKRHIQLLGIPITSKAEFLLASHSAARTLSFAKFLQALHIEDFSLNRKNRSQIAIISSCLQKAPHRFSARQAFEKNINPISWKPRPIASSSLRLYSSTLPENNHDVLLTKLQDATDDIASRVGIQATSTTRDHTIDPLMEKHRTTREVVTDIAAGLLPPIVARDTLFRLGITITPEINRLLEKQDNGEEVSYAALMTLVSRAPGWSSINRETSLCVPPD